MAYTDTFPVLGNFIETSLTTGCMASDTLLYLADTKDFPTFLGGKDHVPCVLRGYKSDAREIVYVMAVDRVTNTVTVLRGMEGTEALEWEPSTFLYCAETAQALERMRVNQFAPFLDEQGNRPAMTWVTSKTFAMEGDFTHMLEPGTAVRVISGDSVVPAANPDVGGIHITHAEYLNMQTKVTLRNVVLPTTLSGFDVGILPSATPLFTPDAIFADGVTLEQNGSIISAIPATTRNRGIVNAEDAIDFVRAAMLDAAHPVGSIYMSMQPTSPSLLFGGTWEAIKGRFLLASDDTWGAGTTGGEATHTLTTNELPAHSHDVTVSSSGGHTHTRGTMEITGSFGGHCVGWGGGWGNGAFGSWQQGDRGSDGGDYGRSSAWNFAASKTWTGSTSNSGAHVHAASSANTGGGKAHNNMPPYLAVYCWKRVK